MIGFDPVSSYHPVKGCIAQAGVTSNRCHENTIGGVHVPKSKAALPEQLHQWPWRGLAFASDLGIIAHLLKQPKLAGLGWLVAAPYYAVCIGARPNASQRKEEAVYQLSANGVFPFLCAKVGAKLGDGLGVRFLKKIGGSARSFSPLWGKGIGGLLGLAFLTPTVGDPLSQTLISTLKKVRHPVC
jgi:hypothetical protein